jgi:uncharacterized membrane protein
MNTRAAFSAAWALALLTIGAGFFFYPALPDIMTTHWSAEGVANGAMPKFWGVFLMPLTLAFMLSIFAAIPHIDPLKSNIHHFRRQYDLFVLLLIAVLAFIQLAVIAINLGATFSISSIVMPAIGVLFFSLGSFLPSTKRNWFVGIRTPWTLSSDEAWKRTHAMAGWIFKVLGVLAIVTILVPAYVVPVFFVPLAVSLTALVVYSYFVYREASST